MSFKENLYRARSHIVFLAAVAVGFALIYKTDGSVFDVAVKGTDNGVATVLKDQQPIQHAGKTALRPDQPEWGKIAWTYFKQNIDPSTGLANSVDGYKSTTMWDTGSYLLALIAAERLEIIGADEFEANLKKALGSLAKLALYDGKLPNKSYNTATLEMVDYNNNMTPGIGYSSLDIARLLVPLAILSRNYPEFAADVTAVIARWDFNELHRNGELVGVTAEGPGGERKQEGRLGYEQYAARSLAGYFLDVHNALDIARNLTWSDVSGVKVPYDSRSNRKFDADVYTTNEPYLLAAFEFGLDDVNKVFLDQIYRAQEARYVQTGKLTAVSEGHLDRAPHFAYATVRGNGEDWAVIAPDGSMHSVLRSMSTKAAFGLDAIYGDAYTAKLVGSAVALNAPGKGWLEGRYDDGGVNSANTANTNGIILEGLFYRQYGPLGIVTRSQ